ncbi:MBL fold metallo-hydrolase [Mucilaginibacter sp. P25]|uniref:MBL fold metallo-hydrolase n=1 Tax=Mucilaginibacter sp. P25 TaxID=3423945 RepID=UPI003D7B06D5
MKSFAAVHSSSFPDGSYAGIPCGFAFDTPDGNFYYSGDTGLTLDMKLVPEWVELDFAVLPIGDGLTMGVEDAIKACEMLKVNKMIGVHYDTFGFIKIDHQKTLEVFKSAGIDAHLMGIGTTIDI